MLLFFSMINKLILLVMKKERIVYNDQEQENCLSNTSPLGYMYVVGLFCVIQYVKDKIKKTTRVFPKFVDHENSTLKEICY